MSVPLSEYDRVRSIELRRARLRATVLLGAAAALFVSTFWMGEATWVEFFRATAEAAVIGGLADWFAVTALFRHPLGIPIPHTAIIPRSKTGLARSLGEFVENNFLAPEHLMERLDALHPYERLGAWLRKETNSRRAADQLIRIAREMMEEVDRAALAGRLGDSAGRLLRHPAVATGTGRALAAAVESGRHQQAVVWGIGAVSRLLVEQEEVLRRRLHAESPWWVPEAVDDAVFHRVRLAVVTFLAEIENDSEHEVRLAIDRRLLDLADRLQRDSGLAESFSNALGSLADSPELQGALVDLVERVVDDLSHPDRLAGWLGAAGTRLADDTALQHRLRVWLATLTPSIARAGRRELGDLIATTIERWDPEDTSRRLELWMGKDLQFVRINGTVVGGLAGLAIHTIVFLLGG